VLLAKTLIKTLIMIGAPNARTAAGISHRTADVIVVLLFAPSGLPINDADDTRRHAIRQP
jgi:hypothetical protein